MNKRLCTVLLAIIGLGLAAWALLPSVRRDRSTIPDRMIGNAVARFWARNGSYPRSLKETEPDLEELTEMDCMIEALSEHKYQVVMPTREGKTFTFVVEYAADEHGSLEVLHVN